jgi:hypothetical protein
MHQTIVVGEGTEINLGFVIFSTSEAACGESCVGRENSPHLSVKNSTHPVLAWHQMMPSSMST